MLYKSSEGILPPTAIRDPSVSVRQIVRALLRHKSIMSSSVLVFLALGGLFWVFVPASYTATSTILLDPQNTSSLSSYAMNIGAGARPEIQDQIEVLRSDKIAFATIEKLALLKNPEFSKQHHLISHLSAKIFALFYPAGSTGGVLPAMPPDRIALRKFKDRLSITRVPNSNVIEVGFTTHDAATSAAVANGVVDEFIGDWLGPPATLAHTADDLVRNRVILSTAIPPFNRDEPGGVTLLAAAFLSGLLFGAAGTLALEYADHSIRVPEQVEILTQTKCLGLLPKLTRSRPARRVEDPGAAVVLAGKSGFGLCQTSGSSQFLENLHRAAFVVDLQRRSGGALIVGVVSTLPAEGKTTAALNLARVLAQGSARVLVADYDTSNPQLSRAFDTTGVHERLPANRPSLDEPALIPTIGEQVHFLSITSPLLAKDSGRTDRLKALFENYDFVLLDMPTLSSADALSIAAGLADALLLIVEWGATSQNVVLRSLEAADQIRSKLIGAVLNKVDLRQLRAWDPEAQRLYFRESQSGRTDSKHRSGG